MNNFYVYMYLRKKDSKHGAAGTPYYVGKGKGKRFRERHNVAVPKERERIEFYATGLTEKEAFFWEILLIKLYGRIDLGTGCLRNHTDGGEGSSGVICSAEARAKISAVKRGNTNCLGRKCSLETRAKMSTNHAGMKGKVHSDETKAKMSSAHIGKPRSAEWKAKLSAWQRGRVFSAETRAKMRLSRLAYVEKCKQEQQRMQNAEIFNSF
jgi:hypothetical protein